MHGTGIRDGGPRGDRTAKALSLVVIALAALAAASVLPAPAPEGAPPGGRELAALVGTNVRLPITGRLVPIIADEHADPELGSGAVKITPGHDFNDFEVGRRVGIEARDMLNMLDAKACIVQTADGLIPDAFVGLSTTEARKAVVARLKDEGVLIPHIDKDGTEYDAEPRTI